MENQTIPGEQEPMSEEDMAKMRTKITAQYKDEIKFLKVQAEYEELMATIEESKLKRYTALARTSNLFAQMESQNNANNEARTDFEEAVKTAQENGPPPTPGQEPKQTKKRTLVKED
jgi:hypothetical protein